MAGNQGIKKCQVLLNQCFRELTKYACEMANLADIYMFPKKLYEEMKNRIESAVATAEIPVEIKKQHKGFSEWNLKVAKNDHQSIVQVCNS